MGSEGSLRCSRCGISYPRQHRFVHCPHCREKTSWFSNVEPDEDWEYSLALLQGTVGEAEDAAVKFGEPGEKDPYWWRAEALYKAGLSYEQAMEVARMPVDLHDACDLVWKAGADLAYEILR